MKVKELVQDILRHRDFYYAGNAQISDEDYDKLEEKLRKIDPDHYVFEKVGSSKSGNKIPHSKKMLSLGKTYDLEELEKWRDQHDCVASFKIDGVSCSLVFEDKKLILAKTRGDGKYGESIRDKVVWIEDIPEQLEIQGQFEIRGEIYCTEENFIKLSDEMHIRSLDRPTSMRNIVAGLLGRKDHVNLSSFLSFMAFELIGKNFSKEVEKIKFLENLKIPTPYWKLIKKNESFENVIEMVKNFDGEYLIDGLVVTFNDINLHLELGETAHHPRYKKAFKFAGATKKSRIEKIEWSVSRNGILTPIAHIGPVELSGAMISKVSLHNFGMVKVHNLKSGDEIEVVRSGEVIPKFLRVIKSGNNKFSYPEICPSCGQSCKIEDIRLICSNFECPTRNLQTILNFIQKIGIEDLSTKRLESLIDKKVISDIPDLYTLNEDQLMQGEKIKEKLAQKILLNISNSLKVDLVTFLSALGLKGGAHTKCQKIVDAGFDTLEKVKSLKLEDLLAIPGMAEKSSEALLNSLEDKRDLIKKLEELGLNPKNTGTKNFKVCITGTLSRKRDEVIRQIKDMGGEVLSSVTKDTVYLITNDTQKKSSKLEKAKKYGTKIVTEDEFYKLF